ncbi:MAG: MBL fold metallo-hydrolase [Elusimicrobiota bacterium]|jgi:metallo-beta-lactamase family protein|nr:MBL fold metallo-hydrolase [Elusimicrobiota bacterium]
MQKFRSVVLLLLFCFGLTNGEVFVTADGAAGMVSGSSFLLESDGVSCIIDAGMFMENEQIEKRNFRIAPKFLNANALVLTHAHTDHIGRVPLLAASGFNGKIYATAATKALALEFFSNGTGADLIKRKWFWYDDNANKKIAHWKDFCLKDEKPQTVLNPINFIDFQKSRKGRWEICKICILSQTAEIEKLFVELEYGQVVELAENFSFKLLDAGHIPGSASVLFNVEETRILFSGDLGSGFLKLQSKSLAAPKSDFVFIETTNGNVESVDENEFSAFRKDILNALNNSKIVWISALSFHRTQSLLYELKLMQDEGILNSNIPIYSLSPSANRITNLFEQEIVGQKRDWFAKEVYEKETLIPKNFKMQMPIFKGPMIIISSSGDMDMGMSKNLFLKLSPRKDVFMMVVNYVSPTSRAGILLANKEKFNIKKYNIFSGHPVLKEIFRWLENQDKKNTKLYLIHGELENMFSARQVFARAGFANVKILKIDERIQLR